MSPAGPVNKGRIAGVALLGLAAAALVVGIVMSVTGGPVSNTATGTSTSAPPTGSRGSGAPGAPGAPSGSPGAPGSGAPGHGGAPGSGGATPPAGPGGGQHGPSSSLPSGATTTVVPAPPNVGGGQGGNGTVAGGGNARAVQPVAAYKKTPVRVYNNSTIRDLAARAADEFRSDGYNVVEVGNYSDGIIPTTTMYFRPGTPEKATAEALAKEFHAQAKPRFPGIRDASPGVIVIVTKDFSGAQKK